MTVTRKSDGRCGVIGTLRSTGDDIFLHVEEIVPKIMYKGEELELRVDVTVGQKISIYQAFHDQRGIVILAENGKYVDEGELELPFGILSFVSDHDEGLLASIRSLVGRRIELKVDAFFGPAATKEERGF